MPQNFSDTVKVTSIERSAHKLWYVDLLRGFAILAVLLIHTSFYFNIQFIPQTLKAVFSNGRYGVQLFFFTSAFTIFFSYANRHLEPFAKRNFFIRRIFRIAPLYLLAIAYYLFQNGTGPSYATGDDRGIKLYGIIENIFFVHEFDPYHINSVVPGGWSIAVEMLFYCFVPVLFKYIKNADHAIYFIIISIILRMFSGILTFHLLGPLIPVKHVADDFMYFYFPNQLPVFAIGILAFFIILGKCDFSAGPLLILFMLALVEIFTKRLNITDHITLTFCFFLLATSLSKLKLSGWLSLTVQYIGTISYSMYLIHFAVLYYLSQIKFIPVPVNPISNELYFFSEFIAVILITVACASISYRYIEVPFQHLGKLLIKKLAKDVKH